jgi:hypothetical protein
MFNNTQLCYRQIHVRVSALIPTASYCTHRFKNYTESMERSSLDDGVNSLERFLLSAYCCITHKSPTSHTDQPNSLAANQRSCEENG